MFSPSAFLALGFALLATASPLVQRAEEGPLKVSLAATSENAVIEAAVTNTGDETLQILKLNSIFSDAPIQKVTVSNDDGALEFEGIKLRYDLSKLSDDDYTVIEAGATVKTTIELAATYDLSKSDAYTVTAAGTFQYTATSDSARLAEPASIATFTSNALSLTVDSATVPEPLSKHLDKRVLISSCSGTRQTALTTALSNTRSRAAAAATAASSGSSTKFSEYFRTTSTSARSTVAARLNAVASAASTTTSGVRYYCTDVYGYCSTNVLAWTLPSSNIIANCDIYYTYLSASTSTCHGQDQWTTTLHELTHAPGVYSPGTDDNAYGYSASIALSSSAAILNADTYCLYAQAIYLGC